MQTVYTVLKYINTWDVKRSQEIPSTSWDVPLEPAPPAA